jgi:hypothetical protein
MRAGSAGRWTRSRGRVHRADLGLALLALLVLAGCPLRDDYFVDRTTTGKGGTSVGAGGAGTGEGAPDANSGGVGTGGTMGPDAGTGGAGRQARPGGAGTGGAPEAQAREARARQARARQARARRARAGQATRCGHGDCNTALSGDLLRRFVRRSADQSVPLWRVHGGVPTGQSCIAGMHRRLGPDVASAAQFVARDKPRTPPSMASCSFRWRGCQR